MAELPLLPNKNNDSCVVPISKPEDIEHARYLISQSPHYPLKKIVVTRIDCGKVGVNRNYLDPTLREWSWHVIEFVGFAEFVAAILDGSPTGAETGFQGCVPDPSPPPGRPYGLIYFTRYTVVKELGPEPLYLSIVPGTNALTVYWTDPGTNYVFTLEQKMSLADKNWSPSPGGPWPVKTNQWTISPINSTEVLYRVRAQLREN